MNDSAPRVIVVVEGGLVQSIFASRPLNVDVLDHDNWKATDRASNPQEWLRFAALAEEIERGDLLEQAN